MNRTGLFFIAGLFYLFSALCYAFDEPFIESVKLDVERFNVSNDTFKRAVAKALVFSRWNIELVENNRILASRDYGKKKQILLKSRVRFDGKHIIIDVSQKYWKHRSGKYRTLRNDIFINIQQMTLANITKEQVDIGHPETPEGQVDAGRSLGDVSFDVSGYKHSANNFRKIAVLALSKTRWRIRRMERHVVYAYQTIKGDPYAVRVEHRNDNVTVTDISPSKSTKQKWLDNIEKYYNFYARWELIADQVATGMLGQKTAKARSAVRPYKDEPFERMAGTLIIDLRGMKSAADIRTLIAWNLHVLRWRPQEVGKNYVVADYLRSNILEEGQQRYEIGVRFHDGALYLLVTNQSERMRYNWLRTIRDRLAANIRLYELGVN